MSSANLTDLTFVPESAYGTTPTDSDDWEALRFTSENFTATPQVGQSQEIRSDRMIQDQFKTSMEAGGGFNYEFSAGTFDNLLEGAMCDTWDSDVLKISTDEKAFSIQKYFSDLTANEYLLYKGMRVSTFSMNFAHGSPINGAFSFGGADVVPSSIDALGAGAAPAESTSRIMNAVSDLSSVEIDSVAFSGCINNITLNINNNLRAILCLGSDTPSDQSLGSAVVSGTLEAYLTDTTVQWYTSRVINQTTIAITFTISDGTNSYVIDIPNARLSGATPNARGINTDVMVTVDFTALYDATEDSSLVITRS